MIAAYQNMGLGPKSAGGKAGANAGKDPIGELEVAKIAAGVLIGGAYSRA